MTEDSSEREKQPILDYATPDRERRHAATRVLTWTAIGILTLLLGTLLFTFPRFNRSHESSPRMICQSNLRQFGQAMLLYSVDHGQTYPDTLVTLMRSVELFEERVYLCPAASKPWPPRTNPTTQQLAAQVAAPGGTSYFYLGSSLTTATAAEDVVVMYEPLANHHDSGMNVLFGSGRVDFLTKTEAQPILDQIAGGVWPVHYPPLPATQPSAVPLTAP